MPYPFIAHNLKRPDMSPILVPDEHYDRCLDDEWSNPNEVVRGGGRILIEPDQPKRPGRPRKA